MQVMFWKDNMPTYTFKVNWMDDYGNDVDINEQIKQQALEGLNTVTINREMYYKDVVNELLDLIEEYIELPEDYCTRLTLVKIDF